MAQSETIAGETGETSRGLPAMVLTALGIVYGDIGTSPIYALRECFHGEVTLPTTVPNVLGILSLVFWALIIVISLKYLIFMLRADNKGEGGIIALVALIRPPKAAGRGLRAGLVVLGMLGVALLYGDGTITPAISVLSAIEGLQVATPVFEPVVLPITIGVLVALFMVQHKGTARIGRVFGPVMLVWFSVIGLLGLGGIVQAPQVLYAVSPHYGVLFLLHHGAIGFFVLGAVFLVVTGGEALYADMGHVGKRPIRLAWFGLVLPALLLSYFGQGALLLTHGSKVTQPFYMLAPDWALYPLVALATAATVIASQAIISGVFSMTRQAMQLGFLPRMNIIHTQSEEQGQIYIPLVNWLLMVATIALVLGFRTSGNLAAAYGVAVSFDMAATTTLATYVSRRAGWPLGLLIPGAGFFLTIDLGFFAANSLKIPSGGWYPLAVAAVLFVVMATWRRGRELTRGHLIERRMAVEELFDRLKREGIHRAPGTAVFLSEEVEGVPLTLVHQLDHLKTLHERVILLSIITLDTPRVPTAERFLIEALEQGFYRIRVYYGYMQSPNVPVTMRLCERAGLELGDDELTYFIGRTTVVPSRQVVGMAFWRERLFAFIQRNATRSSVFYRLPPDRVLEIGLQVEI